MKTIVKVLILLVLFTSLVGCATPTYTPPDLSAFSWREFTINLESGETLTICAVYAKVNVDIFNNITDIVLYDKEGGSIGAIYDNVVGISADQTKECK